MSITKKTIVPIGSTVSIYNYSLIYGRAVRFWVDIIADNSNSKGFELIIHQGKVEISHSLITEIGDLLNYDVDVINTSGQNINILLTNLYSSTMMVYTRILDDEMGNICGLI